MRTVSLGSLEKEIMDIVWNCQSCAVGDILRKLKRKKLAYTTVATIVQRLYEKGMLERKEDGKRFIYRPKVSKENFSKNIARTFLNKFFHSYGDAAIASFAQSIGKLPKNKKDYLLKLLSGYET